MINITINNVKEVQKMNRNINDLEVANKEVNE